MKKALVSAVAAAALTIGLGNAAKAEWPEKPIKLIVPFKAGGTSDQTGRVFQAAIKKTISFRSRSPSSTSVVTTPLARAR